MMYSLWVEIRKLAPIYASVILLGGIIFFFGSLVSGVPIATVQILAALPAGFLVGWALGARASRRQQRELMSKLVEVMIDTDKDLDKFKTEKVPTEKLDNVREKMRIMALLVRNRHRHSWSPMAPEDLQAASYFEQRPRHH